MLRERLSWKGLKYDMIKYVNELPTCQKKKLEHTHLADLLHPFPIPERKWESISMDFITGLPKVLSKDCIFVVVDRLTKFAIFFTTSLIVAQVDELLFKEVFILHGLPKSIVSDRDNIFFSAFWKELFKIVGKNLTPSRSYHPQIYFQTERVNQWLEVYLRSYVSKQQKAWIKWFHLAEFCYNTTFHMSIGIPHFK